MKKIVVGLAAIGFCGLLNAQTHAPGSPETFGTQSLTYLTLNAWNFVPVDSSFTYAAAAVPGFGIYRTSTGGNPWMHAGLQLPEGASVQYFEVNVCDDTPEAGFPAATIFRVGTGGSFSGLVSLVPVTADLEQPGCVTRSITPTPFTVDNITNSYLVEVNMGPGNQPLVLLSVRIGYLLQVSPAPAVARFSDVPTSHPFFQYIEALAASGITAGCTAPPNPNYCPDAPLTRGQMAVFISRALGLHWAP